MAKKMKYFYRELESRNGEYEYHHKMVFQAPSWKKAEKMVRETCANFWEDDIEPDENGIYYHNCSEVCIEPHVLREITELEYEVLQRFLP